MALLLKFRDETTLPVDLEGLTPDWARGKSLAEIESRAVWLGNQTVPLAELFAASGDPSDGVIEFGGDMSRVHSLGAGMSAGTIRVETGVGRKAGAEMSGGTIFVAGSAGDWLGREMRRGRIHIRGDAGDFAGGARAGSRRGMTGGEIFIDGIAGNEIGRAMRRGLIAVGGAAGDSVGLNLLAGTILVFGRCGPRPGIGIRRGTIGLFTEPVEIPLTFGQASSGQPQFIRLLLTYLRRAGFSSAGQFVGSRYRAYHGDQLTLGKGEILVREG